MNKHVKSLVRKTAQKINTRISDYLTYRVGSKMFEKLKQDTGYSVSKSDQRKVKEYAREVFGSSVHVPRLMFLTACRGCFIEGWIPGSYYREILKTVNTPYFRVGHAKTLSRRIFDSDAFPDIAYYINGVWQDVNGHPVKPADLRDLLFSQGNYAFLKSDNSSKGTDVRSISPETFDPSAFSSKQDHVVQRAIQQHPLLEELSPGCVATFRIITTVRFAEPAKTCATYLRLNLDGGDVVSSSRGRTFRIGIEEDLGVLANTAVDNDWRRHELHPAKGVPFSDFSIPSLEQAKRLCERLHERARQFAIIGWDVSVTADGSVEVMEWNTAPAIVFIESALGPNFRHMEWEKLRLGR